MTIMTGPHFDLRKIALKALAVASLLMVYPSMLAHAQKPDVNPSSSEHSRQVTVMAIRAIKGTGPIDPKLATVAKQLAQIMPDHRFELIDGKTKRLDPKQAMVVKSVENSVLTVELKSPSNDEGKVEMLIRLTMDGGEPFESVIKTPANQLFFLDRKINDSNRLLIAVGAR
jgi:hypothetical protein